MARYVKSQKRCRGKGLVDVHGSFRPNSTSAVSSAYNKGNGWSVARTSTGLFSVTFDEDYYELVSVVVTLQLATGADQFCQVGTWTSATRVLQIRVWDVSGAAVADVASDADNKIHFVATFRDTNVSTD